MRGNRELASVGREYHKQLRSRILGNAGQFIIGKGLEYQINKRSLGSTPKFLMWKTFWCKGKHYGNEPYQKKVEYIIFLSDLIGWYDINNYQRLHSRITCSLSKTKWWITRKISLKGLVGETSIRLPNDQILGRKMGQNEDCFTSNHSLKFHRKQIISCLTIYFQSSSQKSRNLLKFLLQPRNSFSGLFPFVSCRIFTPNQA